MSHSSHLVTAVAALAALAGAGSACSEKAAEPPEVPACDTDADCKAGESCVTERVQCVDAPCPQPKSCKPSAAGATSTGR